MFRVNRITTFAWIRCRWVRKQEVLLQPMLSSAATSFAGTRKNTPLFGYGSRMVRVSFSIECREPINPIRLPLTMQTRWPISNASGETESSDIGVASIFPFPFDSTMITSCIAKQQDAACVETFVGVESTQRNFKLPPSEVQVGGLYLRKVSEIERAGWYFPRFRCSLKLSLPRGGEFTRHADAGMQGSWPCGAMNDFSST